MRQSILFQLLRNNKFVSVHNTYAEALNAKYQKYEKEIENLNLSEQFEEPLNTYTIKPLELNN